MRRPYRHIPTYDLEANLISLYGELQRNVMNGWTILSRPVERELNRVTKELDRRKETK